jgi:hypothetical protein
MLNNLEGNFIRLLKYSYLILSKGVLTALCNTLNFRMSRFHKFLESITLLNKKVFTFIVEISFLLFLSMILPSYVISDPNLFKKAMSCQDYMSHTMVFRASSFDKVRSMVELLDKSCKARLLD